MRLSFRLRGVAAFVVALLALPVLPAANEAVPRPAVATPPAAPPSTGAAPAVSRASPAVPLPTVPAEAVPRGAAAASLPRTGGVVMVALGQNNIFPVAQGHINRIVTPFRRAGVQTTSGEEIQARGGIIYVSPRGEAPLTMFVSEDGEDSVAISLTLVPRLIPPVELDLRLPGGAATRASATTLRERMERAERWERGQPYTDTLRDIIRRLALGEVPPGYEAAALGAGVAPPGCWPEGGITVSFRNGQVFAGSQLTALVGIAHNPGREPREFLESWCGARNVAAVALAPSPMLAAGGRSEIFVIVRNEMPAERSTPRPSLLQAGSAGR